MTLQFNPGPYQQAYQQGQENLQSNREGLQRSIDQIPNSLNMAIQYQQQQKQDRMNQILMAFKAKEQNIDPSNLMNWVNSGKFPQAPVDNSQTPSSPPNFNSMPPMGQGQMPGFGKQASAGMPDSGWQPQGSPIVAAHKQHLASGGGFNSLFQSAPVDYKSVMDSAGQGDFSPMFALPQKEQANAMKGYEYNQNREDRQQRDRQITAFQQASLDAQKNRLDLTSGEKNDQFYQKEWDKIVKDSDPITASSRSGLGMATRADYNANRALLTLSKPNVTNQEAGNVMADIAQIYQGGSPTEYGMSHQGYNTLYSKLTGAMQYLTGNPQDSLPENIKQRLVGVLNEMKGTNKAVLKQQLDHIERGQPQVIGKFKDQWQGIRQNLESGIAGGPQNNQGGDNKDPLGLGL